MEVYMTGSRDGRLDAEREEQVLAIMREAFPASERRSDDRQRELMNHPLYRIHTLQEDGRVLGFMAVWDLEGFCFLEHFAIRGDLRGGGLGGRMLDWLKGRNPRIALEVELPTDDTTRRRIGFYRRHGLTLNEREYAQLPLNPGDGPTPMYLMTQPGALNDADFEAVRREIYRHVYGAAE